MNTRGASIVRRLVVTAVVTGLATGLVGALLLRGLERRQLLEGASARVADVAERTATRADGRVAAIEAQLRLLSSRPGVADLVPDAATELAVALRVASDVDQLVVYDAAGRAVAAAASSELVSVDRLPRRPDVTDGLSAGSATRIVSDDDGPRLEIRVAIEEPPGTTQGALVALAPIALLHEEAETPLLGTGATAFLVADDGRIVAHREFDRVLSGEGFDVAATFPRSQRVVRMDVDGTPTLAAMAATKAMPATVVVVQPEASAVAALQTSADSLTLLYSSVVAAIVAALVLVARRALRPLSAVVAAVDRIGQGDLTTRVEAAGGTGEVQVLADGVNRMSERLQQRQAELERAQRAVAESEERLRLMVEGVVDYALVLLDAAGTVRTWNPGATRLLGVEEREALGTPLGRFFDLEDPPAGLLESAAETGYGEAEGWCRRGGDGRFRAEVVARALVADDVLQGYALVLHDVTEQHAAREAMAEALRRQETAAAELRQANAVKDDFLAIVAHELRTPLTAILGSSQLLSRDWDRLGDAEKVPLVDVVDRHAEDLRLVVDRVLHFSRLQADRVRVRPTCCDLRPEIDGHVADLSRQLDGHRVAVAVPDTEVVVDRHLLRHVVTNLLSNAAKFSDPDTDVAVSAEVDGGVLTLWVTDEGVGIPAEDHERIFEIFQQSTNDLPSVRGAGVGLAIVRRYLELVGGSVRVDSGRGQGARFIVTIPLGEPAAHGEAVT